MSEKDILLNFCWQAEQGNADGLKILSGKKCGY